MQCELASSPFVCRSLFSLQNLIIWAFAVHSSLCILFSETPVRMTKFLLQHPRTSAARRSKLPRVLLAHPPKAYESQPRTNFLQPASHVAVTFRKHKSTHAQSAPSLNAAQHPSPWDGLAHNAWWVFPTQWTQARNSLTNTARGLSLSLKDEAQWEVHLKTIKSVWDRKGLWDLRLSV